MRSPEIPPREMEIDPELVARYIVNRLRRYVFESGKRGGVVGVSGGIDSATTAFLVARALGEERSYCYILPSEATREEDLRDAMQVVELLRIPKENFGVIPVDEIVAGFEKAVGEVDRVARGNIRARARMVILYAKASQNNALVIGTGDKSEITIGYFTKYGDAGADVLPIGDLFKTQVRRLAEHLGVPRQIIEKPPTPALWRGQTAEEEIGMGYPLLDAILFYRFDKRLSEEETAERAGVDIEAVRRIVDMVKSTQHKRQMPEIFGISYSHGLDWR